MNAVQVAVGRSVTPDSTPDQIRHAASGAWAIAADALASFVYVIAEYQGSVVGIYQIAARARVPQAEVGRDKAEFILYPADDQQWRVGQPVPFVRAQGHTRPIYGDI